MSQTKSIQMPLPVELLWQNGWPPAALLFWSRISEIKVLSRDLVAADFWSGEKERCKVACQTLADLLFAAGHGEEAIAALMLAADPVKPQTFEIVLPQLGYVSGHPLFTSARTIHTSQLIWLDRHRKWARTWNRLYRLGDPTEEEPAVGT